MITSSTSSALLPSNPLPSVSSAENSRHLGPSNSSSLLSQAIPLDCSSESLREKTVVPKMDSMLPLSPLPLLWGSIGHQGGALATEVLSVGSSSATSIAWSEQTSPTSSSSASSSSILCPISSSPPKERLPIKERSKSTSREDKEKDRQAVIRHHQKQQEHLDKARLRQRVRDLEKENTELRKENTELRKENTELSKEKTELSKEKTELHSRNTQLHFLNAEFLAIHTQLNSINAKLIAMNIRFLAQMSGLMQREQYNRVVNFLSTLSRLR